ncbi:hypothetical protein [Laspinema olomoucense]|uniref:hypothetical protein n=1 Tax=Laspinema olomoucense TaxID=3231600 RepID=UPI0021BAA310|nr:hypothetical protein [Laspinema sp. D3c]MCT7995663.1 hypothetical protein [Laspinema sp. D3c]
MTGSNPFLIEDSDGFNRSFKKIVKTHKDNFLELIAKTLEDLMADPYPNNSGREPLPRKCKLPEGWTFHKLKFRASTGASGQIRLMYLVNETTAMIKLVWIYSHEQFAKRPADADITSAIAESLYF